MTPETLSRLRIAVFLIAGLVIASYGLLALLWHTPRPMWVWLPSCAGVLAGAILWSSARRSGQEIARASFDELYRYEWAKAQRLSYWFALGLYPAFAVALANGLLSYGVAFAAMGTLTGAAPLLAFCVITLRS